MLSFKQFVIEAELLDISRRTKFDDIVKGRRKYSHEDLVGNPKHDEYFGKRRVYKDTGLGFHYLGKHPKTGHNIYHDHERGSWTTNYIAHNPKTGHVDMHVDGDVKKHKNGHTTLDIGHLSGRKDSTLKAHELYHHLITKHKHILVGSAHSEGGAKVWNKLAHKRDVNIHGMHGRTPINLDAKDREETHAHHSDLEHTVVNVGEKPKWERQRSSFGFRSRELHISNAKTEKDHEAQKISDTKLIAHKRFGK